MVVDELFIINLGQQMMFNTLIISMPLLGIGLVVGMLISLFQAVTQIHEQTLTIVPKLLVVGVTMIFMMPWLIERILDLSRRIFDQLPEVARNF